MNLNFGFSKMLIGENIDIGSKLIPSWVSFVVQFTALVILLLIVFFVAYKPVKKILKRRSDFIQKNIEESEKNKNISKQDVEESKKLVIEGKMKASNIVENAKKEADKIKSDTLLETKNEVDNMYQRANEDIELAKQNALKDIQKEMIEVALEASKKILEREINESDNEKLAKDFIEKIKE